KGEQGRAPGLWQHVAQVPVSPKECGDDRGACAIHGELLRQWSKPSSELPLKKSLARIVNARSRLCRHDTGSCTELRIVRSDQYHLFRFCTSALCPVRGYGLPRQCRAVAEERCAQNLIC